MKSVLFGALALVALAGPVYAQDAAGGDAAAGEKLFMRCKACHQIGPNAKNAIGPDLNGVVGRKAGTEEGYSYSPALRDSGLTWDEATLTKWLHGPKKLVAGTKMIFPGFQKDDDIKNVIAYLSEFNADGSKK